MNDTGAQATSPALTATPTNPPKGLCGLWCWCKGHTEVIQVAVALIALGYTAMQMSENTKTLRASIRGQLYQTEAETSKQESDDDTAQLSSLWVQTSISVQGQAYARDLLGIVTTNAACLAATNAASLHRVLFRYETLANVEQRTNTAVARKLFLAAQTQFYHIHNALDYYKEGVLKKEELRTWSGILREFHSHPLFLAVVQHGHQNRYFSRDFGSFLRQVLCQDPPKGHVHDMAEFRRDRAFIEYYYPEMMRPEWLEVLPDYKP